MNKEKEFVNGLMVKKTTGNTPDWIKFKISIKREELIEWLQNKPDEWVNAEVKESKAGKLYCEVNNWKPKGESEVADDIPEDYPTEEVPF